MVDHSTVELKCLGLNPSEKRTYPLGSIANEVI